MNSLKNQQKILLAESAINAGSKRTILTQECLRRIRNTKIELGDGVRNEHLNKFMLKMKNSGYNENYRIQILNSALSAFKKMVEEDKKGTKPLYRSRSWDRNNRLESQENKRINWYSNKSKTGTVYKSILFVPPTPGSVLLKELRTREEELNKHNEERIQIVEKGGVKIEKLLTKKNPFEKEHCEQKWFPLCKGDYGELNIACNTNNVGYRWICRTCEKTKNKTKVYEGETSRSIRIRSMEHIRAFQNKKADSVLHKHKQMEHMNENVEYGLEISSIFKK